MAKLKTDKLITYAYMREECDLPDVIREDELEHKIYRAQEMLKMLLGMEFYNDFVSNYRDSTFSALYTTLYDYVKQFVAWQANEFWTISANFKVHASGFRVHSEDNSTPASDVQMAAIIKDAKYQAFYYKKLMVDYLNAHCSDYVLYDCNCRGSKTGNGFQISAVINREKKQGRFKRPCCG